MKRILIFVFVSLITLQLSAQTDSTKVKVLDHNIVTVNEDGRGTQVKVGEENGVEVVTDEWGDTTKIRIGSRTFKVSEDSKGTHIQFGKDRDRERHRWTGNFNSHWAGLEWGMNLFHTQDYGMYDGDTFMDLNLAKSITVNLNFAEWAFKNDANTFALVTGLGFSFMDFTFDNPVTVAKVDGKIQPIDLNPAGLKKSKMNVSYLTAPLMLELKTPLRLNGSRVYLAGGVIGGLNLDSYTKVKYKGDKQKDKGGLNINQFKYEITGRIGFGDFCIFANYSMTPLFKENLGPELYPLTVGFSFPNF
jgi:hypothetical protein